MQHESRKLKNAITEESDYEPNPLIQRFYTNVFCEVPTLKVATVNQASNYALNNNPTIES